MRRLIFGLLMTLLSASYVDAQPVSVTSGYLVIRVVLDGGEGGGFAAGAGAGGGFGAAPGAGAPGAGPRGRGGPGAPGGGGFGPGAPGGGVGPGGPGDFGPPGAGGAAGGFAGNVNAGTSGVTSDPSKSVVVVVPFHNLTKMKYGNKVFDHIEHDFGPNGKGGKTFLFSDNTSIEFYPNRRVRFESEIRKRHSDWSKNRVLSEGFRLCRDTLMHGMLTEAFKYSSELANQVSIAKGDVKIPSDVADFVKAYQTFEKSIDTPLKSGNVQDWQRRVRADTVTESTHYSLVHMQDVPPEEIQRRLTLLENNFRSFYLWHAMSLVTLPLPDTKMIVILPKNASDVERMRTALDGSTILADASFAMHHNIVILSPDRLDENSRAFQNLVAPLWREGYVREDLLRGIAPKATSTRTVDDHARAMTLALVDKALEVESDFAGISREGTRQLYVATKQVPRDVVLPEWVESGISSLFVKPKGPLFVKENNRNLMTVSLTAGYGSPNFHLRRYFQTLEKSGKLNPNRSDLLMNTLKDKYFIAARDGVDIDPAPARPSAGAGGRQGPGGPGGPAGPGGPGGPGTRPRPGAPGAPGGPGGPGAIPPANPGVGGGGGITEGGANPQGPPPVEMDDEEQKAKSKVDLEIKARTTAWALTYYLSREKLPGLQEFYRQLSRMPRDLHVDENTVVLTFCRSFNLMRGDEIDMKEFERFAQNWVDQMKNVPVFYLDIPLPESSSGGSAPGGFPGGFPGGPGGPGAPGGKGAPGRPGAPGGGNGLPGSG